VSTNQLPRVAVFLDSASASIMEIYEAARETCRIVWVVGWSPDFPSPRVLARFGEVADVSSLAAQRAVDFVAGLEIDGVVVFNDAPLGFAAAVADRRGLVFHSPETTLLLTDKLLQRRALQRAGLVVPTFAGAGANGIDGPVEFPAVLKPRAGAGSRDTFRVDTESEVFEILATCVDGEEFILEGFIPDRPTTDSFAADVVSIESVVQKGAIRHIAVTGRFCFVKPFRETGSFLPSNVSDDERLSIESLASAAIEALGIHDGIVHTEVKMTPSGPWIVEVNGRLGGGISNLVSKVGGPHLVQWVLRLSLGEEVGDVPTVNAPPIAFFRWIVSPLDATVVKLVEGVEAARNLPGVDEAALNRAVGDHVNARESPFLNHVARIEGVVDSYADLEDLVSALIPAVLHVAWA
jgi:biotin carboxylase